MKRRLGDVLAQGLTLSPDVAQDKDGLYDLAYLTCMNVACERSKPLATTKVALGGGRENVIRQTPIAPWISATAPAVDPCALHAAPPSVAASTSSWRGEGGRPCKPARARKSAAIAGPADSTTTNALHNKMDLIIARTSIKAEGRDW